LEYFASLIRDNYIMFMLLGVINVILGVLLTRKWSVTGSKRVIEALGTRNPGLSVYKRCSMLVGQGLAVCGKKLEKGRLYSRALKKIRPAASVILTNSIIEAVVASNKRRVNLRFQKHIYKIYKYLHNQISSGVKPTDAVRTVYEVTDDRELRGILVKLAARYELTLDIDIALEEFRSNFDTHEAETLCIALKQGIDTGDNKDLLARQEDIMFKKYFNYIQAETDSCRNRGVAAAAVYVAIVAVMIIVPLLDEVGQAVGKIFIN
jgi:hypothetical protein